MPRFQAPKGTVDLLPEDLLAWERFERVARERLERYGYREIRTPFFESRELFERSMGETSDVVEKEMFRIEQGGESYVFRPEGTAPVVRAYLEHGLAAQFPFQKLFYLGPMFRYERPQAGRLRQFHQVGVEVLGSRDPRVDVETMDLAAAIFESLGLRDVELRLNSIGCPTCRPAYREALRERLRERLAELCEDCRRRFDRNVFRILDCKKEGCRRASAGLPSAEGFLCGECGPHFAAVRAGLDALALRHAVDPRLVRGFDYYSRTVYEFHHPRLGARSAICGGGRYDGLVEEMGGPPTGACGFALGVETVLLAMAKDGIAPPAADRSGSVFVAVVDRSLDAKAFEVVTALRRAGVAADADFEGRSLKSQMKVADRSGAVRVVILGPDELARGEAKVRDMAGGGETSVPIEELPARLRG